MVVLGAAAAEVVVGALDAERRAALLGAFFLAGTAFFFTDFFLTGSTFFFADFFDFAIGYIFFKVRRESKRNASESSNTEAIL